MDMVCSRPGVRTVPCGRRGNTAPLVEIKWKGGKQSASQSESKTLTVGGMMYDW